jgi:cytochrome c biogenesis protein CcmG/thiol:disulfide interchange protein DsbE
MKRSISVLASFFLLMGLATAGRGQGPQSGALSAREVLDKMAFAYSHARTIHVVAKRETTALRAGQSGVSDAECEIAAGGGHRYYARFKENGQESIALSDGENTWKALASKKQWARVSAASSGEDDEADAGDAQPRDLFGFLSSTLLGQYIAVAKLADGPELRKDEEVKVGGEKIPCYVIRTRAGKQEHELWVDKQRFVVVQHRIKAESSGTALDIRLKTTFLEINSTIADTTFRFDPGKGWSELEFLALPGEERLMLTGSKAINFALKTLDGEPVALDQTRGKVVVLDFWATWCPPCREELPSLEKLRGEFSGLVQFYGVNDEESGTVKDFVKKHHYELTVLMDGKRQVHRQYNVHAIPTLLIVDKQGVIREHFIGSRSEATLRKAIQSVVAAN